MIIVTLDSLDVSGTIDRLVCAEAVSSVVHGTLLIGGRGVAAVANVRDDV